MSNLSVLYVYLYNCRVVKLLKTVKMAELIRNVKMI